MSSLLAQPVLGHGLPFYFLDYFTTVSPFFELYKYLRSPWLGISNLSRQNTFTVGSSWLNMEVQPYYFFLVHYYRWGDFLFDSIPHRSACSILIHHRVPYTVIGARKHNLVTSQRCFNLQIPSSFPTSPARRKVGNRTHQCYFKSL